jgi:hypothetical protein
VGAENISKSYVSRILRLALLAPDIIDAILAGRVANDLLAVKIKHLEAGGPEVEAISGAVSLHQPVFRRSTSDPNGPLQIHTGFCRGAPGKKSRPG